MPYYKDVTQGISFDLNTSNGEMLFNDSFGKKEIKLNRLPATAPKRLKEIEKQNEKNTFYISDDAIYAKSFFFTDEPYYKEAEDFVEGFNYGNSFNKFYE